MSRPRENVERFAYHLDDVEGFLSNRELSQYTRIVHSVVRRYSRDFLRRCRVSYDDVVSAGLLALVEGNRAYTKYRTGEIGIVPFLTSYVRRSIWYFLLWNRSLILLSQRKYQDFSKAKKSGNLSAIGDQEAAVFASWATGEAGSEAGSDSEYYDRFEQVAHSGDCPEQLLIGAERIAIANKLLEDFKATLDSSRSPGLRARREELLAKRILVPDEDKELLDTIAKRWGVTRQAVSLIEKDLSAKFDAFMAEARKNLS